MVGIPVIASHFALISGEIVEKGLGVACDPHDEAALAGLIHELAGDDRRIEEMSRRAFAEAKQLAPTPEQWCDDLVALYQQRVLSARTQPARWVASGAFAEERQ